MIRLLIVAQQLFSLWMLVDAIRRGCRPYWYLVVMMPFGEWVYFFSVKIHDPQFDRLREWVRQLTTRRPSSAALRGRVERSPSFETHLALAQALYDEERYADAQLHFGEALRRDAGDSDARYGMALCKIGLREYAAGIDDLKQVIESEPAFRDYVAWKDAAAALAEAQRLAEALELLDGLVARSPRLAHRALYAHYLARAGKAEQARTQLRLGLDEYEDSPKFIRRKDRSWARGVRKMIKDLAAEAT